MERLKSNLLAIYRAGDAFNCKMLNLNNFVEIDYLIITRSFLNDLSWFISSIKSELHFEWKNRVNIEVLQKELLLYFYERCIYPVTNALLNGERIYGTEGFDKIKSRKLKISSLSTRYLLCKSLYRFNYIMDSLFMRDIKEALRHALYSIKYSLTSLILWKEKVLINCFQDILGSLSRIDSNLSKMVLRWVQNLNNLSLSKYSRKDFSKKSAFNTLHALKDVLKLPYNILSYSWRKINGCKLMSYRELTSLIRKKKSTSIDFLCLDNKPVMIISIDNHEHKVSLAK